ncbi:ISKra4 family transposase [Gemmata obscuriglobus]|nr:ISKra4 family transposase [Gemmata obscuriglobus]
MTAAAQRMAVLAGARDAFARAQVMLRELAGWELDDELIRQRTHATARRLSASRGTRTDDRRFTAAAGAVEVQIDAGKVNTTTGWRDVKVCAIGKRKPGKPAAPAEWGDRVLPPPTIRTVVANVEEAGAFAVRVRAEADRLKVTTGADVTVLGDGAEWIWNLAADVLPQAAGVLDVYHAAEHIGTAVKAVWGDTAEAAAHRQSGLLAVVAGGKAGIERWIADRFGELPPGADGDPLRDLAGYLGAHPTRLGYAERLAKGRSIGSGLIEGSIKQLVNRRMKLTGARWRVEHVGPLVELAAVVDTPDWHHFWAAA